jgi:quercetin dioxygenase-like cupin family protein
MLQPGAHLDSLRHAGEEFIYCQQGRGILTVAGRDYSLQPGHTIYLPGGTDHTYSNAGKQVTHLPGGTMGAARPCDDEPRPGQNS